MGTCEGRSVNANSFLEFCVNIAHQSTCTNDTLFDCVLFNSGLSSFCCWWWREQLLRPLELSTTRLVQMQVIIDSMRLELPPFTHPPPPAISLSIPHPASRTTFTSDFGAGFVGSDLPWWAFFVSVVLSVIGWTLMWAIVRHDTSECSVTLLATCFSKITLLLLQKWEFSKRSSQQSRRHQLEWPLRLVIPTSKG